MYPLALLNLFIISNRFWRVLSLGFSIYNTMSAANSDCFTSFFPIWLPTTSFSCWIAMARNSNSLLKRSGKSEHPSFSWSWRKRFQIFTIENNINCWFVIYVFLIMLKYIPSIVCSLYLWICFFIVKICMETQKTLHSQNNFEKKRTQLEESWSLTSDYYKATVIKTIWFLHKPDI